VFCGIKDQEGKPICRRRLPAELPTILQALDPYRGQLKAVAVESTFNWYWSLQSMVTRHTGQGVGATTLSKWTRREVRATFADAYSQQTAAALLELLREQRRIQQGLEKQVLAVVNHYEPYQRLLTIPGIGLILGITMVLETGPIARFGSPALCGKERGRTAARWKAVASPTARRKERTTARTGTSTWRGRSWRRRTLPSATVRARRRGLRARRRGRVEWWR
jgi:hypothetical protein